MIGSKQMMIPVKICRYQLKLYLANARTWVFYCILFLYIRGMFSELKDFSVMVGEKIPPSVLVFLMNDHVCPMIIFSLGVLLLSHAPFEDAMSFYLVGRIGKFRWLKGEILFLFISSGMYTFAIVLSVLVNIAGRILWDNSWGKVLGTLAYTDAIAEYPMPFEIGSTVMSGFAPGAALFHTVVLMWLALLFLYLVMFLLNYVCRKMAGTIVAMGFILFDVTICNLMPYSLYKFSPLSLTKLTLLNGVMGQPYLQYAYVFLGLADVFFVTTLLLCGKMQKGLKLGNRNG